jgi:hypothetical protein
MKFELIWKKINHFNIIWKCQFIKFNTDYYGKNKYLIIYENFIFDFHLSSYINIISIAENYDWIYFTSFGYIIKKIPKRIFYNKIIVK